MTLTISELRQAHPMWFARGNARYHGDLSYRILHDKQRRPYLVRETYAWSDMFGNERTAHYRINPIGHGLEILPLVEVIFDNLEEVKIWLSMNVESEA